MFRSSYQIYLAHWVSHVHLMVIPALLPFLPEYFGVTFLELGAGMSVLMTVTLILQIPMGFAVDRYGAKRMLALALIIGAAALFSLSVFPNFTWFLVVMAALGFANSIYHPADYALLAEVVDPTRLGRAFSYHTFAGFFGTAVTPGIVIGAVLVFDIQVALWITGAVALAAVYVLEPVHKVFAGKPYRLFVAPAPLLTETGSIRTVVPILPKNSVDRRKVLVTISVLTLFFVLLTLSQSPIQDFGTATLFLGYGFDEPEAAFLVSAFLFAAAGGVLMGGWLADKTQRHGLIAAYAFVGTASLMLVISLTILPFWLTLTLFILVGLLLGVIAPSRDMMVKSAAPKGTEGRMFGIVSTGYSIGGAIAPLYLAWFLDHGLFRWVFFAATAAMVAVVVLSFYQERSVAKAHALTNAALKGPSAE